MGRLPEAIKYSEPEAIRVNLSFIVLLLVSILAASCASGPGGNGGSSVGVPRGPETDASSDAFDQGIKFIRENPSEREDERIQHFLWLDQWIQIFERNNRLSNDRGRELSQDLKSFVAEPPLGKSSLEKIGVRATTLVGRNTANYYLYLAALKESTLEAAVSYLKAIQEDPYSGLFAQAQDLLQMGGGPVGAASGKIGVLVPLSGELKNYGKEIMDSLQALTSFSAAEGLEFVFVDSGDSNESLQAAVQRLAMDENVLAVIGPVTTSASQYVFERAELLRLPVISLAPRERLQMYGGYSFRSALTLRDQIAELSKFIRNTLGAKRVAILFPENDYGWDAAKLAQEAFRLQGLEVNHVRVYPPDSTDFKDPLKNMARLDMPRVRADEVCPKKGPGFENCVKSTGDLLPILDFEVLFVPDFADSGGYLLPTIPFLRMYGIQVVGLSGFHSQKLLERAGDSAEGLIITDSFYSESKEFRNRLFVSRYQELTNATPTKMAAEAFDVGAVLLSIFQKSQGKLSRDFVRDELNRVSSFAGVTGNLYSESQQLRKSPRVLVVRNGQFREFR